MVYLIIIVSTLSAVLFHLYLYRLITGWVRQDFLRSLCEDNEEKLQFLLSEYANVKSKRLKREQFESHFETLSREYDQQRAH
ncbi:hypothetical protein [Aestuariirhabdus litorea]|uniref:Uncharacterized protein n=1 Tax=Aestuariirhabdus litorea TaxID=2528527 RepID=A0A3P3VNP7_9GAMM|nr:hypothetical protein [Aestuariirhabdus litorea]RRJ84044.1 hypothetical protein D0544_02685 [Aestuariirhabdus litorea]RWW97265.1 hypothetical protein DZC74_02680 [Endozoicomonadaceae bacterium GTF-13]